jgi:hypothetical protein
LTDAIKKEVCEKENIAMPQKFSLVPSEGEPVQTLSARESEERIEDTEATVRGRIEDAEATVLMTEEQAQVLNADAGEMDSSVCDLD